MKVTMKFTQAQNFLPCTAVLFPVYRAALPVLMPVSYSLMILQFYLIRNDQFVRKGRKIFARVLPGKKSVKQAAACILRLVCLSTFFRIRVFWWLMAAVICQNTKGGLYDRKIDRCNY